MTVRAFADRAVDPVSGTTLSKSTAGNLVRGHQIKITPEVLAAIAAGLDVAPLDVQKAACLQYVGLIISDPFDMPGGDVDAVVRVAHDPSLTADDMPHTRAFVDQAAAEDAPSGN